METRQEKMETIREKAKRELGEWFAASIKREVADTYKSARELFGLRAETALALARLMVQESLNRFAEDNFYAGLPH